MGLGELKGVRKRLHDPLLRPHQLFIAWFFVCVYNLSVNVTLVQHLFQVPRWNMFEVQCAQQFHITTNNPHPTHKNVHAELALQIWLEGLTVHSQVYIYV